MAKLKSERHHWWPECVSEFWQDSEGFVTRISPCGDKRSAPSKNWGVIQNGHMIKIAEDPAAFCPWDESYEHQFQIVDSNFPNVIECLQNTYGEDLRNIHVLRDRFVALEVSDEIFRSIIDSAISLATRSPRTRERAVALAEDIRGPIPARQRNGLIGMNSRFHYRDAVKLFTGHGKIGIIFSPEKEFIFGDGFFHNLTNPPHLPHNPKIVVPFTPNIAIIYVRPSQFRVQPRLFTLIATDEEVEAINYSVQVYASNMIFYRRDVPNLAESFKRKQHLEYASPDNPIDQMVSALPGIRKRDTVMAGLFQEIERSR